MGGAGEDVYKQDCLSQGDDGAGAVSRGSGRAGALNNWYKLIRKTFSFLLAVFCWGIAAAQGAGNGMGRGDARDAYPVIDRLFKTYAAKNNFPGLVYGIVSGGRLMFAGASGYGDLAKKTPATAGSDFRIASMTKSFVTVAILQLRDAGKLRLDDPAYLYIPELKGQKGDAGDAPEITIRNLLTHSAGFPEDNPWGDRQLAVTDEELLAMVKKGISFSNSPGIAY